MAHTGCDAKLPGRDSAPIEPRDEARHGAARRARGRPEYLESHHHESQHESQSFSHTPLTFESAVVQIGVVDTLGESERANAKLLGASQYEGKPKLKWRAMASRAFEVSTSTGEREQMQLRVWTTAQLASSSSSRRRRLLPSFGTTRKKPSPKTATAFFEFDLTSPQRRAFLRGWNKQGNPVSLEKKKASDDHVAIY